MDRSTVYTSEQGRSVDFLFAQRSTMIGLGKLAQAALGSNTVVRGLSVTANSPAALNVLVGIGEIYAMTAVDATAWGALTADTTDVILKQGLNMAAQTIATPAPATSSYSIVYLIEAQYQDSDTNSAVLPFYNSSNPQIPLNGQGGNGQPLATQRQGLVVIQAKAGIAAPTGTQVAPSVDAGWTALATVTVANGQSTVTSGNIAIPAGVPQLSSLLQMIQTGSSSYAIDTSASANTVTVALTPPITSYVDSQPINFQAANTNTGACTINAGGGSVSLTGAGGAFQGGELVAGKFYEAVYRQNTGTVVVIGQSGGALQIAPATQSQHAITAAQAAGVVGSARNLAMNVSTAAATATLTADEIVVETALGGVRYCLANFSQSINLATTGAGGMDTGTPAAFVAIYAIYNPTTQTRQLLATNAVSGVAPNVYGGANMPTGYTASGLVSVWPVLSSQFVIGAQVDRTIYLVRNQALNTSTAAAASTSLSISAIVPKNAREVMGDISASTTGSTFNMAIGSSGAGSANSPGMIFPTFYNTGQVPYRVPLITAQTVYYYFSQISGTFSGQVNVSGYTI